jgi:hypothetical protein
MLGALYVCLLGLLLVAARRLPTRGALLQKAHLADQPLLMKLPRNITELREVRAAPTFGHGSWGAPSHQTLPLECIRPLRPASQPGAGPVLMSNLCCPCILRPGPSPTLETTFGGSAQN